LLLLAFASLVIIVLLVLLQLTRLGFIIRTTIPTGPPPHVHCLGLVSSHICRGARSGWLHRQQQGPFAG